MSNASTNQAGNQAANQSGAGTAGTKTAEPILVVDNLHKHYKLGSQDIHVLKGVNLSVQPGEWVAVLGASGSGKSTLLHLIGALDRPDVGTVHFEGNSVFKQRRRAQDRYRNTRVGFVFQQYHLLPELNVLENVLISAMIGHSIPGWLGRKAAMKQRALDIIGQMGLSERLKHRPSKLSGGERQRVAIARALINEPAVLLADEPTGNLDSETGKQIMEVFDQLHKNGQAIVMVTHDDRVAAFADRQVRLDDQGRLD